MTRSYGRGTDFACRDQGLIRNGGVHVISTFFPADESENKQINGRTCRQDDPGSSVKIMFLDDLQYLNASEIEKEALGMDWDSYLKSCRSRIEAARFEKLMKEEEELKICHQLTCRACSAVERGDWAQATTLFDEINKA
jgi:preprotein translocase subunit SecA